MIDDEKLGAVRKEPVISEMSDGFCEREGCCEWLGDGWWFGSR